MPKTKQQIVARTYDHSVRNIILRQIPPIVLIVVGIWFFHDRFLALDFSAIHTTLQQVSGKQWGLAVAATSISYWAIGRYDEVIHGLLGTNIPPHIARRSGASSIAIAQFAGFGILIGALVRWRLLPDFTLFQAVRISLAVSVSFVAGWASITAISTLILGDPSIFSTGIAAGVLAMLVILVGLSIWQPFASLSMPSLRCILEILVLVTLDLLFATAAMYAVLPPEILVSPSLFFSVFLLAYGAGLLLGTPGGLGPFELAMITLLPMAPVEPLLASVLAYRVVYYVLPAAIGTLALISGPMRMNVDRGHTLSLLRTHSDLSSGLEQRLWLINNAESNLLRQGQFGCLMADGCPTAMLAPLGQSLVMLGGSFTCQSSKQTLSHLKSIARVKKLGPIIYKCPARLATVARSRGWCVTPVVQEAWLQPAVFSTKGPAKRQLRRQIRKALTAGVTVTECGSRLPFAELQAISEKWNELHDGERGFSMGRYDEKFIRHQRVFVARANKQIIAFISLHENQNEWAIDLLRSGPGAPDGTMHLLITNAIESAAQSRIARLSLAAVPCSCKNQNRIIDYFRKRVCEAGNASGLHQFKNSFSPNWRTLYAAAPGPVSLSVGLIEVLWAIRKDQTGVSARNS